MDDKRTQVRKTIRQTKEATHTGNGKAVSYVKKLLIKIENNRCENLI